MSERTRDPDREAAAQLLANLQVSPDEMQTVTDFLRGQRQIANEAYDAAKAVNLPPGGMPLEEIERQAVLAALGMSNWVQRAAADLLSISWRVMNYKVKAFQINTRTKTW